MKQDDQAALSSKILDEKIEEAIDDKGLVQVSEEIDETPEDILERMHRSLRNELAEELLERVKQAPPP